MTATAIFWSIADGRVVLKARGEHGVGRYILNYAGEEPILTDFTQYGGLCWSADHANLQQRDRNTLTLTKARSLSGDLLAACKIRLTEAEEAFKRDSAMSNVRHECDVAQNLSALLDLKKVFEKLDTSEKLVEDYLSGGRVSSAVARVVKAEESAEPPTANIWQRTDRLNRLNVGEPRTRKAVELRVIRVLTGGAS